MTLEELDDTLPNGLHDAQIKAMTHDYEQATVKLKVAILIGLPDDAPLDRYRYRNGEILFHRVLFCAVETPDNERTLGHPGSIWFQFCRMEPGVLPEKIEIAIAPVTLCYSLYILDWVSEIHIAAGDVSFSWSDTGKSAATL